jgi:hypothetical protein
MTTSNIILIAALLALLSTLSFILLKVSSKEYPKMEEEERGPKFEPRIITFQHCTDFPVAEKPKRKYKKKRRKKPAVTQNETEKRPVGRPRKNQ